MHSRTLFTAVGLLSANSTTAQNQTTMISTNANAPVKCSKKIAINASKEEVWAVLTDINSWSDWQKEITNCHLSCSPAVGAHFSWKIGGAKIHSILHTVDPFEQFGWTGKTFGATAIHNWTLAEHEGKTLVVVDESMDGFLTHIFKSSFQTSLEKGMTTWLQFLKTVSEKGN